MVLGLTLGLESGGGGGYNKQRGYLASLGVGPQRKDPSPETPFGLCSIRAVQRTISGKMRTLGRGYVVSNLSNKIIHNTIRTVIHRDVTAH